MSYRLSAAIAAIAASFCFSAHAADGDKAATTGGLTSAQAKDLKTQADAELKARQKVAEANEVLNKADCKTALEGSAKRACEKSAKANAKSEKADAKTLHEVQEGAIKDAKK